MLHMTDLVHSTFTCHKSDTFSPLLQHCSQLPYAVLWMLRVRCDSLRLCAQDLWAQMLSVEGLPPSVDASYFGVDDGSETGRESGKEQCATINSIFLLDQDCSEKHFYVCTQGKGGPSVGPLVCKILAGHSCYTCM